MLTWSMRNGPRITAAPVPHIWITMLLPLLERDILQMRKVGTFAPDILIIAKLSVDILVTPLPAPVMVMFLSLSVTRLLSVQDPGPMLTVSPSDDAFMALSNAELMSPLHTT